MQSFGAVMERQPMVKRTNQYSEQTSYEYPFLNPGLSTDERIENILAQLTVEEKIALFFMMPRPLSGQHSRVQLVERGAAWRGDGR